MFSAAKETIPRGRRRNYIPCWDEECESLYKDFTSNPDGPESTRTASALLQKLDKERRRRWNEAVQSIDFAHSGCRSWTIINNFSGHSRHPSRPCFISANAIASQLIRNGKCGTRDCETTRLVREETSKLWKIPTSNGSSLTREFSAAEFADALQKLKPGKAPGPDQICPELILHAGPIIKSWLRKFLSSCLCQLRIPKVWRRSLMVAIPKPNKPLNDAKSYRPISLFCIPSTRSSRGLFISASSLSPIHCSYVSKQDSDADERL